MNVHILEVLDCNCRLSKLVNSSWFLRNFESAEVLGKNGFVLV
jgi:hypothetical protein